MKFVFTVDEAKEVIREHLGQPQAEVEILLSAQGPAEFPLVPPLAQIIKDIDSLNWATTQKIPAIKRIRDLVLGLGLADAKWIIENWPTWKAEAQRVSRLPELLKNSQGYVTGIDFAF